MSKKPKKPTPKQTRTTQYGLPLPVKRPKKSTYHSRPKAAQ